ncbi:MAG: glycosyltransferase [Byssovorax sp.]
MSALAAAITASLALSTAWTVLGTLAVARVTERRRGPWPPPPPVSVLKPLCGADPGLEANLATFFEQDHPACELLFGVERADDPAVAVVERLLARYPHKDARLVVHAAPRGHNPKVKNLRGLIDLAKHDLVLISDSNIRAPRHYVAEAASIFASDPQIGLVTHLFAGHGERSLGAKVECVELTGFVAAGAALPTVLGDGVVVGKSMLFSRSDLARLGGLGRVADVLAEDFVIGKMFEQAGRRVAIAPTVLSNVLGEMRLATVFDRHLRWSMLRIRLRPLGFLLEPLTCPLALALLAAPLFGAAHALAWLASMYLVRDVWAWLRLRGPARLWIPMAMGPLRDALALAVWIATPWKRHVSWRGHRLRVGRGTVLEPA